MKKTFSILALTLSCALLFSACQSTPAGQNSDTSKEAEVNLDAEKEAKRAELQLMSKYASMAFQLEEMRIWPDDSYAGGDDWDRKIDNFFAIYDIDNDGRKELSLVLKDGSNADMAEMIVEYNPKTGEVHKEAIFYPGSTFYNGYVFEPLSHNQGLGELWPYNVHQYDAETDTYKKIGSVDSWSKEAWPKDYDGNSFPDELDVDGNGIVYYISDDSESSNMKMVDDEEYNSWIATFTKGGKLNFEYTPISKETLAKPTADYINWITDEFTSAYGDSDSDFGLQYMQGKMSISDIQNTLTEQYDVKFKEEGVEYAVGKLNDTITFECRHEAFDYIGQQVDDIRVLGIHPGMNADDAVAILEKVGFTKSDEYFYTTGENEGDYIIYLDVTDGAVSMISMNMYCIYGG